MLRAAAQRPASRQRCGLPWNRAPVIPVALSQSSHSVYIFGKGAGRIRLWGCGV